MGVVGQDKQHERRIDDHYGAPGGARPRTAVPRGGAHEAEQPQRGDGQHGDVVEVPHEARDEGALRLVLHQDQHEPCGQQTGGPAQVAGYIHVGAAPAHPGRPHRQRHAQTHAHNGAVPGPYQTRVGGRQSVVVRLKKQDGRRNHGGADKPRRNGPTPCRQGRPELPRPPLRPQTHTAPSAPNRPSRRANNDGDSHPTPWRAMRPPPRPIMGHGGMGARAGRA